MFTGRTMYKNIEYNFLIEDDILKIESTVDDGFNCMDAFVAKERRHNQKEFICHCSFTGQSLIAVPNTPFYSFSNNTMIIRLKAIFAFEEEILSIHRMVLYSPELNYIYASKKAIDTVKYSPDGKTEVSIKPISDTTVNDGVFKLLDSNVELRFSVSRTINFGNTKEAFRLESIMLFAFQERNDYEFHLSLYRHAKNLIRYLCYRKNVSISSVSMQTKSDTGLFKHCCDLITFEHIDHEHNEVVSDRFIPYTTISCKAHKVLQDIIDGSLFIDHLPESNRDGRTITAARFIMIVAAFDWEFRQMYPDGVSGSTERKEAEESVKATLSLLIEGNTSRIKEIYKYLKKRVEDMSMKEKVFHAGNCLANVIDVFGKSLYATTSGPLTYDEIGQRLGDQRNNFAHGNIDKEFIGESLNDIVFLQRIVYAMQLRRYADEVGKIQQAVSDLFHLNLDVKI